METKPTGRIDEGKFYAPPANINRLTAIALGRLERTNDFAIQMKLSARIHV